MEISINITTIIIGVSYRVITLSRSDDGDAIKRVAKWRKMAVVVQVTPKYLCPGKKGGLEAGIHLSPLL